MALGTSTTLIRGVIYPPVPVSAIAGITGWVARHWYESTSRLFAAGRCDMTVTSARVAATAR